MLLDQDNPLSGQPFVEPFFEGFVRDIVKFVMVDSDLEDFLGCHVAWRSWALVGFWASREWLHAQRQRALRETDEPS